MVKHACQYPEHQLELEHLLLPEEERFDWKTISHAVIQWIPKHKAYGMTFEEYQKERSKFSEFDTSEKKHLTFYLPLFPSMISGDISQEYKLSKNRFIVMLIELGLITFQYDYHEQYSIAKSTRRNVSKLVTNESSRMCYIQLDKQNITLNSCSRGSGHKHYSPNVPEWLYDAISDASTNINMTISDFAYLCWCIGMVKSVPMEIRNPVLNSDIELILKQFDYEFKMYTTRIKDILCKIKDEQ